MSISSIKFPPGTITPKLSRKFLKQTPSHNDWMHQTYTQMIQDVHYATTHYYETKGNGTGSMLGDSPINQKSTAPGSNNRATNSLETIEESAIYPDISLCIGSNDYRDAIKGVKSANITSNCLSPENNHNENGSHHNGSEAINGNSTDEDDDEPESDDQSVFCNTFTTSSTDCNKRNNIFRFYREQQNLQRPMDEEEDTAAAIKILNSQNHSLNNTSNISNPTVLSLINSNSHHITNTQYKNKDKQPKQQQGYNKDKVVMSKKVKLLKSIIAKMRSAAEKPFRVIDRHF